MTTENFQTQLKQNFANGSAGAFVASVIWLGSAFALQFASLELAFAVLFFGGMTIFPVSVLLLKVIMKRNAESKGNLGGKIVMETIPTMIVGFFAAWLLMRYNPDLVMPIATLAVGAHYVGFRSAYGDNMFLLLAGIICSVALLSIMTPLLSSLSLLYAIATIEFIFGFILLKRSA